MLVKEAAESARARTDTRSPLQVAYDLEILNRVLLGIEDLKREHGDGWVDLIDLDTLQLSMGSSCVLGQVYAEEAQGTGYDGFGIGRERMGLHVRADDAVDDLGAQHGFDFQYGDTAKAQAAGYDDPWFVLQRTWADEIERLQAERDA